MLFLIVRGLNRMMMKAEEVPPPSASPSKQEVLLSEIRDILKARG